MRVTKYLPVLLLLLLAACTPARTGVVDGSLASTLYPPISVEVDSSLVLHGHGREWVTLATNLLTTRPLGSFDYAVYSGGGAEGPVTRHAHVIFLRPENTWTWVFVPESQGMLGALYYRQTAMDGMTVTEQIMPVSAKGDWLSALWRANGREVPERWLARRFSATPDRALRVVAEYREPWPACLPEDAASRLLVPGECLEDFLQNSGDIFTFIRSVRDADAIVSAPSGLKTPEISPNTRKLAGELREANDLLLTRHVR